MDSRILGEDNHLIVVNKPSGWVTQGALPGAISLYDEVVAYIREKYRKPGNVFLGVVSRLDAPVSGVVCFARTSKAASRLNEQFRGRDVQKTYLAVVHASDILADAETATDHCEDFLLHDERSRRVRIVPEGTSGAKYASLDWSLVDYDAATRRALLKVHLHTGRRHQIRVQLASRGLPIVGDTLYATDRKRYDSRRGGERGERHGGRYGGRSGERRYSGRKIAERKGVGNHGWYDERREGRSGGPSAGMFRIPERICLHAWRLSLEHPVRRERLTFAAPVPDDFFPFHRFSPGDHQTYEG
ncbi:MAG: RluA family pseudouridine synthase [Planctomycetia bacterium]|nr:RluA family pseudouridine synthase [Planctomycetia bacterium]